MKKTKVKMSKKTLTNKAKTVSKSKMVSKDVVKTNNVMTTNIDVKEIEKGLPAKNKRSSRAVVVLKGVDKVFEVGSRKVEVLKDINLTLHAAEMTVIYGPSGCGKSTLLHTILGLEKPTKGSVGLRGKNIYDMDNDERTSFRREKVGMVFQQANWIKSLNVWENVAYPLHLSGFSPERAEKRAKKLLGEVGLVDLAEQRPMELSGGQQQRVSLARALATDPWFIIADEPTGNLDSKSSTELMRYITRLNREKRRMILIVTHDMSFLPLATRRIGMKDGRLVSDDYDK